MTSGVGNLGAAPPPRLLWIQSLGIAVLAVFVGQLFLREPGFGDDLDYWRLAFQLHEQGGSAWSSSRFHDLRWPVWGVSWLIQSITGPGLASFHGVPIFYLIVGALAAFVFATRLLASSPAGWFCALVFLFHPLLDSVCFRPMPDLSEGVWGALVVLGWWATMEAERRDAIRGCAASTGLALVVLESNRITGAFTVPVLFAATLVLYRGKFSRLLLIGLFAALGYAALSALYHAQTGDWWHDLHANLRNKDAKGIEAPPLWLAPFRFLDSLWDGGPLAPAFCTLAVIGTWRGWRHCGKGGRIVVLWAGVLLLTYSCAPQRLWPYKPMLRDADRFLAALAIPLSVLAVIGLATLAQPILKPRWKWLEVLVRHPAIGGVLLAALLLGSTDRDFRDLRTVHEIRRHLAAKADGTRVLSHAAMRDYAFLVAPEEARRLHWIAPPNLLVATAEIDADASACAEFWYARQPMWVSLRNQLERGRIPEQPPLPGIFSALPQDWRLDRVIARGNLPDFVFFSRRTPIDPPPIALKANDAAWKGLVPPLPATWERGQPRKQRASFPIPPAWRGSRMFCELRASSPQVEGVEISLVFHSPDRTQARREYRLRPYLFPKDGQDFFAFEIPADAARCDITLIYGAATDAVHFTGFHAWLAPAEAPSN